MLVAAVATRGTCADVLEHVLTHHELAVDENLVREIETVLLRKFRAPDVRVEEFTKLLRVHGVRFDPEPLGEPACRDPDDDRVLALGLASGAEILVTGDPDLLVLDPWKGVRIVRPIDFWRLERSGDPLA